MDLDKLKKMNDLAHELKEKGFAESSNDASDQAREIFNPEHEEKKEQPAPPRGDALVERKYQLLLEMHAKKWQSEIEGVKTKINELIAELEKIREAMQKIETKPAPKVEKQVPLSEVKGEPSHPRHGEFTSDDVAIEKLFYFGEK